MDLSLDADAALRAYLPPESWNGDAQHRFVFRTEEGDEETLLARLAVIQPDVNHKRFEHCVVLRPESAETSRIFIAENLWYRSGCKSIDAWMTPRVAKRFNWALFEQSFNDSHYMRRLCRFWLGRNTEDDAVLRIGTDGWGEILEQKDICSEGFIWGRDYRTSHDQKDLRFLRQKHNSFQRQIRALYNHSEGDVRVALKWRKLNDTERDRLAFHCKNGEWSDLLDVARLALRMRLGRMKHLPINVCAWDLTAYGEIWVGGADLHDDDFLFAWRAAIVQVFQPDNVDAAGKMIDERPLCVWSYVGDRGLGVARVEPPSQHELVEANLKLREWAKTHLSPDEAERLLAL